MFDLEGNLVFLQRKRIWLCMRIAKAAERFSGGWTGKSGSADCPRQAASGTFGFSTPESAWHLDVYTSGINVPLPEIRHANVSCISSKSWANQYPFLPYHPVLPISKRYTLHAEKYGNTLWLAERSAHYVTQTVELPTEMKTFHLCKPTKPIEEIQQIYKAAGITEIQ